MDEVVITYGTFDLFHIGHLNLLKRAKSLGNKLIVGVSTDEFAQLKGKSVIVPFKERIKIVESIKYVDLVIPETCWEQKVEDIKKFNVSVLVMGDDWKGKFDFLKKLCKIVYLPRTKGISTSQYKHLIRKGKLFDKILQIIRNSNDLNEIKQIVEQKLSKF